MPAPHPASCHGCPSRTRNLAQWWKVESPLPVAG
jgi:hypothetical protein